MSNHNRKSVTGEDNSRKVIDLSGKSRRKATKLASHQAFSALFYKSEAGSAGNLYREVQAAYAIYLSGDLEMAARFQPDLNKANDPDRGFARPLIFQQAFMKECVRKASPEVLDEVHKHISIRYATDNAKVAAPWLPGKAEVEEASLPPEVVETNRVAYYQRFAFILLSAILFSNALDRNIDLLPRSMSLAMAEVEKMTGFSAILIIGGRDPKFNNDIQTHV